MLHIQSPTKLGLHLTLRTADYCSSVGKHFLTGCTIGDKFTSLDIHVGAYKGRQIRVMRDGGVLKKSEKLQYRGRCWRKASIDAERLTGTNSNV